MTKRSRFEQAQRRAEDERVRRISDEWMGRLSPAELARFRTAVEEVRARPPAQRPPDMAPGTLPNPPRPGREPREPDARTRSRR